MAQATAAFRLPASGSQQIMHRLVAGTGRGPGVRAALLVPMIGAPRVVLHPISIDRLSASLVHDAVTTLRTSGFTGPISTPALSLTEIDAFEAVGFSRITELALLRLELTARPARVSTVQSDSTLQIRSVPPRWRKSRSDWISAALRVDQLAFPQGEAFDELAIQEALEATPQTSMRFACSGSQSPGSVVGYAISGGAGRRSYLQRLAVDPARRGTGIGAALCEDAIDWARSRRAHILAVNTRQDNQRAYELYVRLGFEPIAGGLIVMGLPADEKKSP
jgi:[ribosomal protein S18]-alanine N-acetyltransferase